jgi:hypothetical protein
VLAHPFWKRRPTREELGKILDRITDKAAPPRLAVDDRGEPWAGSTPEWDRSGWWKRRHVSVGSPFVQNDRRKALAEIYQRMTDLIDREKYEARQGE